jgi:hypothetical protein
VSNHSEAELDAVQRIAAVLRLVHESLTTADGELVELRARATRQEAELGELRAELAALSNRVESLTRAAGLDAGRHSIKVAAKPAASPFVVFDTEADPPAYLGGYRRTIEDIVEYDRPDGTVGEAPEDHVRVVAIRTVAEFLHEAAKS